MEEQDKESGLDSFHIFDGEPVSLNLEIWSENVCVCVSDRSRYIHPLISDLDQDVSDHKAALNIASRIALGVRP